MPRPVVGRTGKWPIRLSRSSRVGPRPGVRNHGTRACRITALVLSVQNEQAVVTSTSSSTFTRSQRLSGLEIESTKRIRPAFVHGLQQLAAVFLLEAAAIMTTLWATPTGFWMDRWHGTTRPDMWEIFGGHSEITLQASKMGWVGMRPIDILYGTDLRDPA